MRLFGVICLVPMTDPLCERRGTVLNRTSSFFPQGGSQLCLEPGQLALRWDWDTALGRLRIEAMKPESHIGCHIGLISPVHIDGVPCW
jgi:hypothetical protein